MNLEEKDHYLSLPIGEQGNQSDILLEAENESSGEEDILDDLREGANFFNESSIPSVTQKNNRIGGHSNFLDVVSEGYSF